MPNIKKAIGLLERARYCDERAHAAYTRAGRHPGTATMDREIKLSWRWDEKADKAWNEAMNLLKALTNGKPE